RAKRPELDDLVWLGLEPLDPTPGSVDIFELVKEYDWGEVEYFALKLCVQPESRLHIELHGRAVNQFVKPIVGEESIEIATSHERAEGVVGIGEMADLAFVDELQSVFHPLLRFGRLIASPDIDGHTDLLQLPGDGLRGFLGEGIRPRSDAHLGGEAVGIPGLREKLACLRRIMAIAGNRCVEPERLGPVES